MGLVEEWWSVSGLKMLCLSTKLKCLKQKIKEWNLHTFKNIFGTKESIEEELQAVEEDIMQNGMNSQSYVKDNELLGKYEEVLAKEEIFWRQKYHEVWLKEGDKNKKFFHNSTRKCCSANRILSLKRKDGSIIEDPYEIAKEAILFFKNLLNNTDGSNFLN